MLKCDKSRLKTIKVVALQNICSLFCEFAVQQSKCQWNYKKLDTIQEKETTFHKNGREDTWYKSAKIAYNWERQMINCIL